MGPSAAISHLSPEQVFGPHWLLTPAESAAERTVSVGYKDADPVGALRKPTAPEPPRLESKAPDVTAVALVSRLLSS